MIDERLIGKHIRDMREGKGMTQASLASATGISITQISGYENGKTPSLTNLAKISQALDTLLDRLYFGDESESFINVVPDDGHVIVNCLTELFHRGVIRECIRLDPEELRYHNYNYPPMPILPLIRYLEPIERLLSNLEELSRYEQTYDDPDMHLKQIKDSVANEING